MSTSQQAAFDADLTKINATIEGLGALVTYADGFVGIDPTKVPDALLRAYRGLLCFGYANGLI